MKRGNIRWRRQKGSERERESAHGPPNTCILITYVFLSSIYRGRPTLNEIASAPSLFEVRY